MKTKLITTSLVAFVIGLSAPSAFANGNGSSPKGKPFIEIQGQIVEVQNDISTLEDAHQTLVDEVNALELDVQGQIDALNAEVTTLQATDAALQADLADTIAELDAQGVAINDLLTSLGAVTADIIALGNAAGDNANAIADLEAEHASISAGIAALDAGLVSAMAEISDNASLISMLEDDIAALEVSKQNDIFGQCPAGTAVETVQDDGSLLCGQAGPGGGIQSYRVTGPLLDLDNTVTFFVYCVTQINGVCLTYAQGTNVNYKSVGQTLVCPAGFAVTGGGHGMTPRPNLYKTHSYPQGINQWFVLFQNRTPAATNNYAANGFAQCLKIL